MVIFLFMRLTHHLVLDAKPRLFYQPAILLRWDAFS